MAKGHGGMSCVARIMAQRAKEAGDGRRAAATVTGTAADRSGCVANPVKTEGPFPADGTDIREGIGRRGG
jgi:hypothetical protein